MDTNTVTVTFTNLVDLDAATPHITATVNGTAVAITVAQVNEVTLAITPVVPWPAASTVNITVDAATASKSGDTLGAAVAQQFVTP
jgi:hypothetical protein